MALALATLAAWRGSSCQYQAYGGAAACRVA